MTLGTIAYKNIVKRKGKTALVLFGLSLAVAALVSVISINQLIHRTVDEQLDEYGFNVVITPKTTEMNLDYGGLNLGTINRARAEAIGTAELAAVQAIHDETDMIRSFSPKLLSVAEINGKRALLAGVDLTTEHRVKDWWVIEAGRYPETQNELFIGEISADRLGLASGDRIDIFEQQFTVAGILMETGSQDDEIIFVDLKKLREVTGKTTELSLIDVAAKTTADVEPLTKALGSALPAASVQSVRQAVKLKENALGHLLKFGLGVNAIIVALTTLIIFTMTASSVIERKSEIGIFRAIGFRRRAIMTIILGEISILGAIGGVLGYFLGFGLARLLPTILGSSVGSGMMTQTAANTGSSGTMSGIGLSPVLLLISILLALTIGIFAAWFPARRAAGLDPVEALKSL